VTSSSQCDSALSGRIGVIFDWDGVIIDSGDHHRTSWQLLAAAERKTLPAGYFEGGFGQTSEMIVEKILKWANDPREVKRLCLRKEALYRDAVRIRPLPLLPGVLSFATGLREAGIPFCIGSSTHRENIALILQQAGQEALFDAAITAEDVSQGKPAPEVFLKAAVRIGRLPADCVVFEDAFAGFAAARAAGMKLVGVATTHPLAKLAGHVDVAVERLTEFDMPRLMRLFA
jgi:HAD superfamily hydrolase (TIGR01509 family)